MSHLWICRKLHLHWRTCDKQLAVNKWPRLGTSQEHLTSLSHRTAVNYTRIHRSLATMERKLKNKLIWPSQYPRGSTLCRPLSNLNSTLKIKDIIILIFLITIFRPVTRHFQHLNKFCKACRSKYCDQKNVFLSTLPTLDFYFLYDLSLYSMFVRCLNISWLISSLP